MPDLSNLLLPALQHFESACCSFSSSPARRDTEASAPGAPVAAGKMIPAIECEWRREVRFPISDRFPYAVLRKERRGDARRPAAANSLEEHVRAWVDRKVADGVPENQCVLPFLTNAPKLVECRFCKKYIHQGDKMICSVRKCQDAYHRTCAKHKKCSSKDFKCPQHACFICKQKNHLRCVRCNMAFHFRCSPWPTDVLFLTNRPGRTICWRHPLDWRLEKEHADPTSDMEEAFHRLPLAYVEEDYEIGPILNDIMENNNEPAPYIHIRRSILETIEQNLLLCINLFLSSFNGFTFLYCFHGVGFPIFFYFEIDVLLLSLKLKDVYLVKRKRDGADTDVGCTNCNANSSCRENCECRGLSLSCSKACHCSEMCTNRPFRKEKRIKVVKTKFCGWGAVTLESIEKGDFVIEYIGEVIDDALCEQRLWDMKRRGNQNFYMCEIRKDFTIDATFKGNASRFLNHSCHPNCKLEKWQVDGETRVGVFALQSIQSGEPLTYDYRFVQFGPTVKCYCESSNCQGFLGSKRKTSQTNFPNSSPWGFSWGRKRLRTPKLMERNR